jgi:hypothetical protein
MTNPTPLEEAVERLRSRLNYPSDGRSQTVTAIETIVRKADLRTVLNALSIDEPMELGAFLGKTLGEAARVSIDEERVASMRNTIILILDANYHTAISKAQSTADQIVQSIVGEGL